MYGLSPEEWSDLVRSVGTHRSERPCSPVDVARLIKQALKRCSRQQLADALHFRDATMIGRFVRLLALPADYYDLISWGNCQTAIPFKSATEIARLEEPNDQKALIDAVIQYGMTGREVEQVVQIHKRSGRCVAECIGEILKTRPIIVRRHALIGAIPPGKIRESIINTPQVERDLVLEHSLHRNLSQVEILSVKLSPDRFTILTTELGYNTIMETARLQHTTFEDLVVGWLQSEIY